MILLSRQSRQTSPSHPSHVERLVELENCWRSHQGSGFSIVVRTETLSLCVKRALAILNIWAAGCNSFFRFIRLYPFGVIGQLLRIGLRRQ